MKKKRKFLVIGKIFYVILHSYLCLYYFSSCRYKLSIFSINYHFYRKLVTIKQCDKLWKLLVFEWIVLFFLCLSISCFDQLSKANGCMLAYHSLSFIIITFGYEKSAWYLPEVGCSCMSTDDNNDFLSKRFLTFAHDTSVSAAAATARILESNNKYRIWLLIPTPKIDFLLWDSLAQQHSFTYMFIKNLFINLK